MKGIAPRRVKPSHIMTLVKLAQIGAQRRFVEVSTRKLGSLIGLSQQSASRILLELEDRGLVERIKGAGRSRVRITVEGLSLLIDLYGTLKTVFEKPMSLTFRGTVFSGLGEGAYYVKAYSKLFEKRLGFKPYPGTLNVKLDSLEEVKAVRSLLSLPGITIESFSNKLRSYGRVKCFKAYMKDEEVYLVFPERTHYGADVVEVISPVNLREKLRVKDGDNVHVKVPLLS